MAELSFLCTVLAPQDVRLHRVLPALVMPFLFILAPQRGMREPSSGTRLIDQLLRSFQHGLAGATRQTGRTFCPITLKWIWQKKELPGEKPDSSRAILVEIRGFEPLTS